MSCHKVVVEVDNMLMDGCSNNVMQSQGHIHVDC